MVARRRAATCLSLLRALALAPFVLLAHGVPGRALCALIEIERCLKRLRRDGILLTPERLATGGGPRLGRAPQIRRPPGGIGLCRRGPSRGHAVSRAASRVSAMTERLLVGRSEHCGPCLTEQGGRFVEGSHRLGKLPCLERRRSRRDPRLPAPPCFLRTTEGLRPGGGRTGLLHSLARKFSRLALTLLLSSLDGLTSFTLGLLVQSARAFEEAGRVAIAAGSRG